MKIWIHNKLKRMERSDDDEEEEVIHAAVPLKGIWPVLY